MANLYTFSNFCNTTLNGAITSGATTLTLTSATNIPTIPAGTYWPLILNDVATRQVYEIVYVTAATGAVCTVLRGQEGTTAQSWNSGDYAFAPGVTRDVLNGLQQTSQPYIGSSLQFVNVHPDSLNNFSSLTQLNSTPFSIPAGALTLGAVLRVRGALFYSVTGTPNLEVQIQIAGQDCGIFSTFSSSTSAEGTGQRIAFFYESAVNAVGAGGSTVITDGYYTYRSNNIGQPTIGIGNGIPINTTIANNVNIFGSFTVANVANSMTMQSWTVEIVYPPAGNVIT